MVLRKSIMLLLGINLSILSAPDTIHIPSLDLSLDAITGFGVGIRPVRVQVRIEAEYIENKLVIHNYGHGGAGMSLSWGSAYEVIDLLDQEVHKGTIKRPKSLAVIGSGVMGLSVAHLLLVKGYTVHIYAKEFPPHTTSDIANGIWTPTFMQLESHQDRDMIARNERITKKSFDILYDFATNAHPQFVGVSLITRLNFSKNVQNFANVSVQFISGLEKKARAELKLVIDSSRYMPDLFNKAKELGATVTERTIANAHELVSVPEEVIINCTGFGSKKMLDDKHLIPVREQLIYLKPQALDYILFDDCGSYGNKWVTITPCAERIIVGGFGEDGQEDCVITGDVGDILVRAAKFLGNKG